MLLRSPSSLPISASVVAVKPLRAKHFAAAARIAATRGFSQSTARGAEPDSASFFSSSGADSMIHLDSVRLAGHSPVTLTAVIQPVKVSAGYAGCPDKVA